MPKSLVEYSPISVHSNKACSSREEGKQNIFGSILTLVNTCIGSGLIAMPYAIAQLGLLHGLIWMIVSTLIIMFSLHCLSIVACSLSGNRTSFFSVAEKFTPNLRFSIDLSIIIQGWGVCLSYLILIGNSIPALVQFLHDVFSDPTEDFMILGWDSRQFSIIFCVLFIIFPLCCLRTLKSLKFMSVLAIISVGYIFLLVLSYFFIFLMYFDGSIIKAIQTEIVGRLPISLWKWSSKGLFTSVPIFIFGLTCHHNIFNIYNELKSPRNISKLNQICYSSITLVGLVYFVIAAAGYITLGDGVNSKLFDSYEYGDPEHQFYSEFSILLDQFDPFRISLFLGRLALLFIAISAFPIQFYPIRISIHNLWISFKKYHEHQPLSFESSNELGSFTLHPDHRHFRTSFQSNSFHYFITTFYCFSCLILALNITEFGKVLSIVGSTGDNYIALFFGPYLYLVISKKNNFSSCYYWKEICSYLLLLFAILLGITVVFVF